MAVDIPALLDDLSLRIDRLKILYEQFFLGIEKLAPTVARREVEKAFDFLGKQNIGNTAMRFRYLGVMRKWKTYAERWDKVQRDIENGTYAPHRARVDRARQAERDRARPLGAPKSGEAASMDAGVTDASTGDSTGEGVAEAAGGAMGRRAAARERSDEGYAAPRPDPAAASVIPGMSEADLRTLHQRYVEARRVAGEAKPEVRYETLVTTLSRQLPDILERNRCREIGFDIVVRDGKVILKALPRR